MRCWRTRSKVPLLLKPILHPDQLTGVGLGPTEIGSVVGQDPDLAVDYRIGPASPTAAAGVVVNGVHADIDGVCYSSPPAIGAHETS